MYSNSLAGVMAAVLTLAFVVSTTIAQPHDTQKDKPKVRTDALGDPLPQGAIARLGTLRLRGCRRPVLFSPDGKYIVTVGGDSGTQAVFWDRSSGQCVKTFTVKESIFDLAFSPDGKKLAAVGNVGFFNPVWDVGTGKTLFTFKGKEIAFRDSGKELISTYPEGMGTKVRSIDAGTGQELTEWELAHTREEGKLVLSPDGRFAAFPRQRDKGCMLVIFDLAKREEIKRLHLKPAYPIGFSNDGLRLFVGGVGGFSVWDWPSSKLLCRWAVVPLNSAAFSYDGRRLAWIDTDENGAKIVWRGDVDAARPHPIRASTFEIGTKLTFSPEGNSIAALTGGNAVVLFDSCNGRDQIPFAAHYGRVWTVEYSADGHHVITRDSARLLMWDAATGRLLRRLPDDLPEGETILANTLSHGRIITVTLADGTLHLRDATTAKEIRLLKGGSGSVTSGLWDNSAVSADGSSAAIRVTSGIRIFDLNTGEVRCQFGCNHSVYGMNFSADGSRLEVTIEDPQDGFRFLSEFYDVRSDRKIAATAEAGMWIRSDGRWIASSKISKTRIRDLKLLDADGRPALAGEDGFITHVQESPNHRFLAVAGRTGHPFFRKDSNKNFLRVWDITTRRPILELDERHRIGGFSPEGRTFVSSTYATGTIHLWELATGRERLRFGGHLPGDVTIRFRKDGRVLVSGGADTQVFLWDVTGRSSDGIKRETRHSPERMRTLWHALAGDDAAEAYRAMWALADAPAQTVAWMREQLPPIAPVERRQLMRLLTDLDSDEFAVRSKASEELERFGELVGPALRDALAVKPTLERRRRCEDLLAKLAVLSSQRLRAVRAVEVLEHIGTAEARALLERLSRGVPEARQTQEAKAALQRMQ